MRETRLFMNSNITQMIKLATTCEVCQEKCIGKDAPSTINALLKHMGEKHPEELKTKLRDVSLIHFEKIAVVN